MIASAANTLCRETIIYYFAALEAIQMEDNDHIGARLDRLPLSRFHFRIFGIISFGLLLTGFLSYSGNVVLAKLIDSGWSNN